MTPDEKVQKWKRKCNQCGCEIKSEEIFCGPTCAYNYARQLELEKLKIVVSQSISREAVEKLREKYKQFPYDILDEECQRYVFKGFIEELDNLLSPKS